MRVTAAVPKFRENSVKFRENSVKFSGSRNLKSTAAGPRIPVRCGLKFQESKPYTHTLSYFKENSQLPRNQKLGRFEILMICQNKSRLWQKLIKFVAKT